MTNSGKKHIVFIITGLLTGGAELMLYKLLSEINRNNFNCTVISLTSDGPVGDKIRQLDIPVKTLAMRPGIPSPAALIRLSGWLRQMKPDLVQTWMYHADLVGGIASKLAGNIPLVWGIRNNTLDPSSTKLTTYWTVRVCALLSGFLPDMIISNTQSAREIHIQSGYTPGKISVIPNGFDLTTFKPDHYARQSVRQELEISPDCPIIGLISRFDPMKDHHNFIKAAAYLQQRLPDIHYLLCGNGITWDNTDLQKWIDAGQLRSHFHLLGRREDMPRLTAALDISTMCSYGDAFPNAIGEAMACAVPCVVTDVGDLRYIVDDTGIVVPPRDSMALANAWQTIIKMPVQEKERMGTAARKRVKDKFSLPVIITMYENLYLELIGNQKNRKPA